MKLKLHGTHYPIEFGPDKLRKLLSFVQKHQYQKVYLLADRKLKTARTQVKALFQNTKIQLIEIPVTAGEGLKDIESVYPIYGSLLEKKADRDSLLLALGGGSIGDVGGFVASTYLRGIAWVGLPTTLLAQVDSAIGGKTGINHQSGKNLIGTFHQPRLVICETRFLETLRKREIASGLGEIVKYGCTFDQKFFHFLAENLEKILNRDPSALAKVIGKSIAFKVKAVEQDELDRTGVREVLNFGHTFAHALETLTDYQTYQHGEAVVWGMRFAVTLSVVRGHLSETVANEISALLKRIPVPALSSRFDANDFIRVMKKDKKSSHGRIRFVLLCAIGKSLSDRDVTEDDLHLAFERMKS